MILGLGPVVGSWLGGVIRRWPAGQDFVRGRSRCDSCGATLGAAELVPVLSFAVLRGRCRHCGAAIGWFALTIELAAFSAGALALAADGATPAAWFDAALGWALLLAAWIDAETFILPDLVTLPLVLAGLAVTAWQVPGALTDHAVAAAAGYAGFRVLNAGYRALRGRDGLGAGDAKLLAAAGAWLGLGALPWLIFFAAALGIIAYAVAGRIGKTLQPSQQIPFGPALAVAFFGLRLAGW
jgi:leader peptidase (prepilin peptidase)/N-methyltransferase